MTNDTSATAAVDVAGVQDVPARFVAAWADNDADSFASVCTEDATMVLPGGIFLRSRDEIRDFMAAGFAGDYKGTRVTGTPVSVRFLAPDVAVLITEGGVLDPGDTTVTAKRAIRAIWVLSRTDESWLVSAYQNTPVAAA
ncbi:SgcJ/EcaC family oxidoreductase [Kibdelosporangium lantanae]